MAPQDAHAKLDGLFKDCMVGRTMYVLPYCMGPIDSPYSRCGVEITDSPYVVVNMRMMTRMGSAALARIERDTTFVKGLHSTGDLSPERRFIMHFPEELSIMSIGSGYGGNALLGKKCHALRIASWQARHEGWLAEHMLILALTSPAGAKTYIAAAFPSACGKTNLAMLVPPDSMPGWKVETIGDDIAWLHRGEDGRLYAINPEAGYFGVVPGTSPKTNPHAYDMIQHDTIFTNVAQTADGEPWWEGRSDGTPAIDWRGHPVTDKSAKAAHPNSRFTVSAKQNPVYSAATDQPQGVPISAIVFGGRRRELAPLVYQARDWEHGVLIGAGVASETTAAATGETGVVRRDPMAMKPFCGYNFGDYWAHWLKVGGSLTQAPEIFHVNWFRQDKDGHYLWPGFGENLRVLQWIAERCSGNADAVDTPIGFLPKSDGINTDGLQVDQSTMATLLSVDAAAWRGELASIGEYLESYGSRLPTKLKEEHKAAAQALKS
jgi:phosphoenolpyruvate carboxykinase (GTP)